MPAEKVIGAIHGAPDSSASNRDAQRADLALNSCSCSANIELKASLVEDMKRAVDNVELTRVCSDVVESEVR
jgi:hypothetical protein